MPQACLSQASMHRMPRTQDDLSFQRTKYLARNRRDGIVIFQSRSRQSISELSECVVAPRIDLPFVGYGQSMVLTQSYCSRFALTKTATFNASKVVACGLVAGPKPTSRSMSAHIQVRLRISRQYCSMQFGHLDILYNDRNIANMDWKINDAFGMNSIGVLDRQSHRNPILILPFTILSVESLDKMVGTSQNNALRMLT